MKPSSAKRSRTLSFRIVLVFTVLLGAMLLVVSVLARVTLRAYLTDEMDKNLSSSGKVIASQTLEKLATGTLDQQLLPSDYFIYARNGASGSDTTISTIHPRARAAYGTPANPESLLVLPLNEPTTVEGTTFLSDWRVITLAIVTQDGQSQVGTVLIGLPTASITKAVRNLTNVLMFVTILIVLAGAGLSFFLVKQSLKGLHDIEVATHSIADGDLTRRVPTGPAGSEVGMLADSINVMLAQIEHLFAVQAQSEERMRRFVSDASHELRTPLATVRGYAELYRLGGVPEDQTDHAFGRIEAESKRMAALVEDLLKLARLDEGRKLNWQDVDLTKVAINTVTDFLVRAPERDAAVTALDGNEADSVVVWADPDAVTQVITNLLTNVLTHTPREAAVEVAVGVDPENPSQAIVEVRDHGPGIQEKDRERVFERFYRTDVSRSRESGGSGLGLAIVAAMMAAHNGTARVAETPGGGLTVRLSFPFFRDDHSQLVPGQAAKSKKDRPTLSFRRLLLPGGGKAAEKDVEKPVEQA